MAASGIQSAQAQSLGNYISQPARGLYVPLYQRAYSWGQENIDRLFEDIGYGITRLSRGQDPASFLGTTIAVNNLNDIYPQNPDALPTAVHHIIDGQQRLTTVLLVFAELADAIHRLRSDGPQTTVSQWIAMQLRSTESKLEDAVWFNMNLSDQPEYQRWPRLIRQGDDKWGYNAGNSTYSSPIASHLHQAWMIRSRKKSFSLLEPSDPFLAAAVIAIRQRIEGIMQGEFDYAEILSSTSLWEDSGIRSAVLGLALPGDYDPAGIAKEDLVLLRLLAVARFLLHDVQIIEVVAPTEEYAFAIFEPLNTTGQLLTALETFKPLLVKAEGGSSSFPGSPSDVAFASATAAAEGTTPEERQRRTSDLLTPFALAQSGEKLARRLGEQRKYLRNSFPDGDDQLADGRRFTEALGTTGRFLREFWNAPNPGVLAGDERAQIGLAMMRASNHTIVQALLSRFYEGWLASGADTTNEAALELRGATRTLAAFWTLWRLSRSTTANIDSHHRTLMRDGWTLAQPATHVDHIARLVNEHDPPDGSVPTLSVLQSVLRDMLSTKGNVKGGQDWMTRTQAIQVYAGQAITKYALLAAYHDCQVAEGGFLTAGVPGSQSTLTVAEWNNQYTLEHIAPQQPIDGDHTYSPDIYEQGMQHRLGNLTLVPAAENASLGQRSWIDKRLMYRILGTASVAVRDQLLTENGLELQDSTAALLGESQFLPYALSVAEVEATVWGASNISSRSKNLAWHIWNRLAVDDLGAPPLDHVANDVSPGRA